MIGGSCRLRRGGAKCTACRAAAGSGKWATPAASAKVLQQATERAVHALPLHAPGTTPKPLFTSCVVAAAAPQYMDPADFNQTEPWCPRVRGAAPDSPCANVTARHLLNMGSGLVDIDNCRYKPDAWQREYCLSEEQVGGPDGEAAALRLCLVHSQKGERGCLAALSELLRMHGPCCCRLCGSSVAASLCARWAGTARRSTLRCRATGICRWSGNLERATSTRTQTSS